MSHQQPWSHVKFAHSVVIKVANGEKPPRPVDDATVARGLDDKMWDVLEKCWAEPENRPSIEDVLCMLWPDDGHS